MSIGLVGCKIGMTRTFTEDGTSIPVSVIHVSPNRITQIKTTENDGYQAIQVTSGEKPASRVNQPTTGHYKSKGVAPGNGLHEFRVSHDEVAKHIAKIHDGVDVATALQLGAELTVSVFEAGQKVDVIGTSKGKGFAGTVKRHNFRTQDATHGNSRSHRVPGSIGQCQTPGRVFKGKKMSGQMGNVRKTIQNLEVVSVDASRNLILVKGAIPGATNSVVYVKPAVKHANQGAK